MHIKKVSKSPSALCAPASLTRPSHMPQTQLQQWPGLFAGQVAHALHPELPQLGQLLHRLHWCLLLLLLAAGCCCPCCCCCCCCAPMCPSIPGDTSNMKMHRSSWIDNDNKFLCEWINMKSKSDFGTSAWTGQDDMTGRYRPRWHDNIYMNRSTWNQTSIARYRPMWHDYLYMNRSTWNHNFDCRYRPRPHNNLYMNKSTWHRTSIARSQGHRMTASVPSDHRKPCAMRCQAACLLAGHKIHVCMLDLSFC